MPDSDTGDSGEDIVEVNVGFDGDEGRKSAVENSAEVVREFGSLDVVTVRIPQSVWTELENHPEIRYVEENGQTGS
ncbi:hypothetical protein ACFFQF_00330 [Haladaptatus pallidirubidus]|uniref:Uncharacterized protein n=1 Tax=Haladaptatus pallidirubidus TaxID=1008152 RepID=A0AAV3UBL1_9EURY|nr:hypothetical protein [Haladaptatus pallidirubidus]